MDKYLIPILGWWTSIYQFDVYQAYRLYDIFRFPKMEVPPKSYMSLLDFPLHTINFGVPSMETPGFTLRANLVWRSSFPQPGRHPGRAINWWMQCNVWVCAIESFFLDLGESSFLFPLNGHVVGLFPIFRHSHVTIISWIWFGDSGCGMMKLAIKMSCSDS